MFTISLRPLHLYTIYLDQLLLQEGVALHMFIFWRKHLYDIRKFGSLLCQVWNLSFLWKRRIINNHYDPVESTVFVLPLEVLNVFQQLSCLYEPLCMTVSSTLVLQPLTINRTENLVSYKMYISKKYSCIYQALCSYVRHLGSTSEIEYTQEIL